MGTTQVIIVFFALMALIALVTIGIDWVGKPLRNRRFIPRIYRFEDEKLPVDAYGNTSFAPAPALAQPAPVVVAQIAPQHLQVPPPVPVRRKGADKTVQVQATQAPSRSAFSDTLATSAIAPSFLDQAPDAAPSAAASPSATAAAGASTTNDEWQPGAALDATSGGRKPNLATKAERYWRSIEPALTDSHFDNEDRARMQVGKAPRRNNPRTGRVEKMELTGLRQASLVTEVRMSWPDRSVDPWNA